MIGPRRTGDWPLAISKRLLIDHDKLFSFTRRPDFCHVGQQLYAWLRWGAALANNTEIERCALRSWC